MLGCMADRPSLRVLWPRMALQLLLALGVWVLVAIIALVLGARPGEALRWGGLFALAWVLGRAAIGLWLLWRHPRALPNGRAPRTRPADWQSPERRQ